MPAVWTETQIINNLLRSGTFWSGNTITYSFPTIDPGWEVSAFGVSASGWSALSAAQRTAATVAIGLWDDLIAPSLTPTTGTGNITLSNFQVDSSNDPSNTHGYYAITYTSWYTSPTVKLASGDVFFNSKYGSSSGTNNLLSPTVGQWGFNSYIHELGHAFGLQHPGTYNGGSPTYAANAAYTHDSIEYSVMSYFDASNTGADWQATNGQFYYPQTPMIDDVAAMQQIYGADMTTRTGNTTYGFNSTLSGVSGGIYDFTQNAHPVLTIWDAGGNDTLDLSGYTTNSRIDLHAGSSSDCDGMTNNIWIAYNTTIENATGGSGNDIITGNDAGNILIGNAGNDTIVGGAGNDKIIGGTGNDVMTGGLGNDSFIFFATDLTVGQADTITDFTADASGIGDTICLIATTGSSVSAVKSGANAVINYGNGTITDTIALLTPSTNPIYVYGFASAANAAAKNLASGFLFVSEAMNQAAHTWSSYLNTYDASSVLSSQNMIYDNGSRVFTSYDTTNQTWATITDSYNISNVLTTRNTVNDDGSHVLVTYNTTGQNWATTTDTFNTNNVLTSHNTVNNDGSHVLLTYDTTGQSWTTITDSYNASNVLLTRNTMNDNGTRELITYDTTNQPWTTITEVFDASSRATTTTYALDTGEKSVYHFDATNTQTWSSYSERFSVSNALMYLATSNDDGTSSVRYYDYQNNQDFTNYIQSFDAAHALISTATYYDNGTSLVVYQDYLNNQTWNTNTVRTDATGQMNYWSLEYKDATRYVQYVDTTNTQNWHDNSIMYDAAGKMVYWQLAYDDTSIGVQYFDHNNNQTWSSYTDHYDTKHNLDRQTIYFDDLTSTSKTFDVNSAGPWSQDVYVYNASNVAIHHYQIMDNGTTLTFF
ncbi:MAG: M10 family metallopeptidase [Alphaproteobacteria bacterium]|nr:M10 family metallopeptidase [Alphaproteobacteria bacterium]